MKKTINLRLFLLYIYAFIIIYLPNLSYYIKINGIVLFLIFTVLYLFIYVAGKNKNFMNLLKYKSILLFIFFNILFTLYFSIRTALAGTSLTNLYQLRIFQNLMPILIFIGVLIVYSELEDMNFSRKMKYKFLIKIAVFQGILSISMIFFPQFRNVAYNIFYQINTEFNIYISTSRLYGICDGNYTYSFQILSAMLALFSFIFAYFYREKRYYLYSIIIFMSTILNGRTGIIIYGVGLAMLISYIIIKEKKLIKSLKILIISTFLIILLTIIIETFLPNTAKLVHHAVGDIYSYVRNKNQATETSSLISGFHFPKKISHIIFGAGYRVYGGNGSEFGNYLPSDIGFINDLYMCGIFSFIFLYGSYFILVKNIKKEKFQTSFEKFMIFILFISAVLSNIKGELFRSQTQVATILMIIIFIIMEGKKENEIYDNSSNL